MAGEEVWMEKKATEYGRRKEKRWTPTRAKSLDTRASPNRPEAHLVRKWRDILHLRALSPWNNGLMDGKQYTNNYFPII